MKIIYENEEVTIETLVEYYEEQREYSLSINEEPPKFFEYLANLEKVGLLETK